MKVEKGADIHATILNRLTAIEERIKYFSQAAAGFNPANKPSSDVLDKLFREVLKED